MKDKRAFQQVYNRIICQPNHSLLLVASNVAQEDRTLVSQGIIQMIEAAQYKLALVRVLAGAGSQEECQALTPQANIDLYEEGHYKYKELQQLFDQLIQVYDYILIEGLALSESSLTQLLAGLAHQLILVVNQNLALRKDLIRSRNLLDQYQVTNLIVVNHQQKVK